MRYIKIAVPDEFDEESLSGDKLNLVDYNKDGGQSSLPVEIWKPSYHNVLNHGFVGLVDFMGDDMNIVHAARVSYGRGTKKVSSDRGLVRYLMRHRHTTPFEMCEFMFHVKAPIFVFRQWHRHRTASINEYSGRYSVLDSDFYLPELPQTAIQSSNNRQGREDSSITQEEYMAILAAMEQIFNDAYQSYSYMLGAEDDGNCPAPPDAINNRRLWVEECALKAAQQVRERLLEKGETLDQNQAEELIEEKMKEYYAANELAVLDDDFPGLARELARIVLPVATYSQMYWKSNLKNTLHFIGLRSDPHAQWEIRQYSDAMIQLIQPYVPWAVEAFLDYQFEGATLSRIELEAVAHMFEIMPEDASDPDYWNGLLREKGCSMREVNEFMGKLEKGAGPRHFEEFVTKK